jgi:peptide/nickel transport system permease protein
MNTAVAVESSSAARAVKPPQVAASRAVVRRLLRRPAAAAGLVVITLFVGIAIFAPWIAPYDPIATSFSTVRKAPSALHWFGTDEIGRDVLSRIVYGARASLLAGVVSVLISLAVGVPVGLLAGYAGGTTDILISRITDAMLACPFLILAIALADFLGGIWAQGYGQIYFDGIKWLMRIRIAARATFVVAIVGIVAIAFHGFRPHPKRQAEAAAT